MANGTTPRAKSASIWPSSAWMRAGMSTPLAAVAAKHSFSVELLDIRVIDDVSEFERFDLGILLAEYVHDRRDRLRRNPWIGWIAPQHAHDLLIGFQLGVVEVLDVRADDAGIRIVVSEHRACPLPHCSDSPPHDFGVGTCVAVVGVDAAVAQGDAERRHVRQELVAARLQPDGDVWSEAGSCHLPRFQRSGFGC